MADIAPESWTTDPDTRSHDYAMRQIKASINEAIEWIEAAAQAMPSDENSILRDVEVYERLEQAIQLLKSIRLHNERENK